MALPWDNVITKRQILLGGKGSILMLMESPSQPSDAPNEQWQETYYDGKPGSWCPEAPVHWHKHHDEHLTVVQGKMTFIVNGKSRVYAPEDGEIFVPRLVRHGFKCHPGVEVRFRERTTPNNINKHDFYDDFMDEGLPDFLGVMRAFHNGDCYLALPGGVRLLEAAFTNLVGGIANWWKPRKNGPRVDRRPAEET